MRDGFKIITDKTNILIQSLQSLSDSSVSHFWLLKSHGSKMQQLYLCLPNLRNLSAPYIQLQILQTSFIFYWMNETHVS